MVKVDLALSDPLAVRAHDALKAVEDLHLSRPRDLNGARRRDRIRGCELERVNGGRGRLKRALIELEEDDLGRLLRLDEGPILLEALNERASARHHNDARKATRRLR